MLNCKHQTLKMLLHAPKAIKKYIYYLDSARNKAQILTLSPFQIFFIASITKYWVYKSNTGQTEKVWAADRSFRTL